jgi:hypothetical protein
MGEYNRLRAIRHAGWVIVRVIMAAMVTALFLVFVLTIKFLGGD